MSRIIQLNDETHQPHTGALMSSDTPKDMEPMKSLRVVLSQSHTSTERRRSLSDAFNLLHTHTQTWENCCKIQGKCVNVYWQTHKMKDSFQVGLSEERMVRVFCLVSFLGSGMSLSFTYGSDSPLGSIGMRFLASPTKELERNKHEQKFLLNVIFLLLWKLASCYDRFILNSHFL